jgi:hypothetical protein
MPIKLVEVAGKTYAEVADGKPIYINAEGKETPFDIDHSLGTIGRLNGEAKGSRERYEAAETKLKSFEGIEDPEVARKALQTVSELDAGSLVKLAKVEEIRAEAKKAAETQVAEVVKAATLENKKITAAHDKLAAELSGEKIGNAFATSKFIADKVAIPTDMLKSSFGSRFAIEDGKIVGKDVAGNKIYSLSKPGDVADFDEALSTMVEAYPHRDSILKGTGARGDGARGSSGAGSGSGSKTITRAAFDALGPAEKMASMKSGVQPVDA